MKSFFSAAAALSLLFLLASVANALPNLAAPAKISVVKARNSSAPVGQAVLYHSLPANLDINNGKKNGTTYENVKTASDGEVTTQASDINDYNCAEFFGRKNFEGPGSKEYALLCCWVHEPSGCCTFPPLKWKILSARAPYSRLGGVYLWQTQDCRQINRVRWLNYLGTPDMSGEPTYLSMSVPTR